MSSGYPGIFPGSLSTGYVEIGAVQKQRTNAKGYPGTFPGGLSVGYLNIGAVGKELGATPPTPSSSINQSFFSMWN